MATVARDAVRALAVVNVAAIERNCRRLCAELTGGARLGAVVKADGYGHGAVPSARAALAGGAGWLAVAAAAEAAELRSAGLDGPLLVMGALTDAELALALECRADIVVWRERDIARLAGRPARVHVKLDTGMGRLGTRDRAEADRVLETVAAAPELELVGAMTHFATADESGDEFFGHQLHGFSDWVSSVRERHPDVIAHAANSAATLRDFRAHFDLVRCGIAIYGMDPFGHDPADRALDPALELISYVAEVKPCAAGQSAGYGRRFVADRDTMLAVLPIGYGDGWRRALTNNADVLIRGVRRPLVGTVSMDNITVDLGPETDVAPGDPAVLIGRQGDERITAEEVAGRLGTISYEVTCALRGRSGRLHHRDGEPTGEP